MGGAGAGGGDRRAETASEVSDRGYSSYLFRDCNRVRPLLRAYFLPTLPSRPTHPPLPLRSHCLGPPPSEAILPRL